MKKLSILLCTLTLLACNVNKNQNEELAPIDMDVIAEECAPENPIKYRAMLIVDSLSKEFPNKFDNDIQEKKYANAVWDAVDTKLKADNTFLSDIPLQFSMMVPKGNKYILKFECGEYSTKDDNLISKESGVQINCAVYAEANEDLASTLIDKATYHVSGKYKGKLRGNLVLPSGDIFEYPATCWKFSDDIFGTLCIGGYLFDDIKFDLIKNEK